MCLFVVVILTKEQNVISEIVTTNTVTIYIYIYIYIFECMHEFIIFTCTLNFVQYKPASLP